MRRSAPLAVLALTALALAGLSCAGPRPAAPAGADAPDPWRAPTPIEAVAIERAPDEALESLAVDGLPRGFAAFTFARADGSRGTAYADARDGAPFAQRKPLLVWCEGSGL